MIFMSNRDYQAIAKMLEEIEVIEDLISDSNLTGEFRESHTHISWKALAGMRDITAHKYQTLKMGDVWTTLVNDIPRLKNHLNDILNNI